MFNLDYGIHFYCLSFNLSYALYVVNTSVNLFAQNHNVTVQSGQSEDIDSTT